MRKDITNYAMRRSKMAKVFEIKQEEPSVEDQQYNNINENIIEKQEEEDN